MDALQRGDAMRSIDDLQIVIKDMKAVRDEARALGVYGGQEARQLSERMEVMNNMIEASDKEAAEKNACTKATQVPVDCMMSVDALRHTPPGKVLQ